MQSTTTQKRTMGNGHASGASNSDRIIVIRKEREWHEREAGRRDPLDRFLYDPPAFDNVVQPAIAHLQACEGELVLDLGCGEGKETLELAARDLNVISVDLSHRQLSRARQRLQQDGGASGVHFVQANAEALPFAAGSFRIVYGKAIVHHLDDAIIFGELDRVMPERGRVTVAEPLAHHPLFWLFRRMTPGLRTEDERPMTLADLQRFAQRFDHCETDVYFLLAPLAYVFRLAPNTEGLFRLVHGLLQRVDRLLFRRLPPLRRLAWYGLARMTRGPAPFDSPRRL